MQCQVLENVVVNCGAECVVSMLSDADIPHVMISYHWGCQKTMIYVRDKLKAAGYKVWMDIDNMSQYWFCFIYRFFNVSGPRVGSGAL